MFVGDLSTPKAQKLLTSTTTVLQVYFRISDAQLGSKYLARTEKTDKTGMVSDRGPPPARSPAPAVQRPHTIRANTSYPWVPWMENNTDFPKRNIKREQTKTYSLL